MVMAMVMAMVMVMVMVMVMGFMTMAMATFECLVCDRCSAKGNSLYATSTALL